MNDLDEPSPELLDRIRRVQWFEHVSESISADMGLTVSQVADWQAAIARCGEMDWENTTLQARNELTVFLNRRCPNAYQKWNEMTKNAKSFLAAEVKRSWTDAAQRLQLPKVVLDCVEWDVLAAIMEDAYRRWSPPEFFRHLFCLYEQGHFPCGWDGSWPEGKLVVY